MSTESPPAEDLRADAATLFGALRARALRIAIVTAVLLVATFFILMFMPRVYESSANLLLEERGGSSASDGSTIDALIAGHIEQIISSDTLMAVIDSQGLRTVPEFNGTATGPLEALLGGGAESGSLDETVLRRLHERLSVSRDGSAAVITITMRSSDAQLAATIANAIATIAVERAAGQALADPVVATPDLQQIEQQRAKVAEADRAVANYRQPSGASGVAPDLQLTELNRQLTEAQGRRASVEQRAAAINELLRSSQPVEAVDDVRTSAVVQSLMQSRATLQTTLAEKRAILLPAHPTMRSLNAQIAQLNGQISNEAQRIADSLAAQAGIEANLIASLTDDLARAQSSVPAASPDNAELDALIAEARAQRDLLDSLVSESRSATPALFDMRIITPAVPAAVPVSPKGMQVLIAVGVLALAVQIAAVVLGARRERHEPELELVSDRPADSDDVVASLVAEMEADMADMADLPEPPPAVVLPAMPPELELEPELEVAPTPEFEPEAWTEEVDDGLEILAADLALGRARIVLIAGIAEGRDAALVADALVSEALDKGLSVCRVDAGSGRPSAVPGLTDLCADEASFGDVVHKVRDGLAEVPWGQTALLDRRSSRPATLVEALADIYEVVIVSTGGIGLNTNLPIFAGVPGRLVLARQALIPRSLADAVMADAASIGFNSVESVLVPGPQAAVA
ncbi:MAG: hypothetical protein EOP22_18635 [Hyphomicrobiales bacterium]|nr:MAG: hypothetical protein EOP22_18635 [Hyphomicrobiales bacterium]